VTRLRILGSPNKSESGNKRCRLVNQGLYGNPDTRRGVIFNFIIINM
jgi:hypothetical protein